MTTRAPGRHRAPTTSRSRLTQLGDTVVAGASTYRRRSAVIAASSGLLVTMGLPAVASPVVDAPEQAGATAAVPVVEPASVTATGSIRVPTGARVDFALGSLTAVDSAEAERAAAQRAAEEAAVAERATAAARASRDLPGSRGDARGAEGEDADGAEGEDDGDGDLGEAVASLASSSAAIEVGSRYIGTPYRFGGTSPDGFDCSGFIQYVYDKLGVSLPRTAAEQQSAGTRVSAAEAQPGDIVSFTGSSGVYHNGIYAGDGKMLDSPRSGKSIAVRDIWSSAVTFTRVA